MVDGLDWKTTAEWMRDVVTLELSAIDRCFLSNQVSRPTIVWSPDEAALPAEPLKIMLRYWRSLSSIRGVPFHGDIDPVQFAPALGYINILERIPDSLDLRYRLFGSKVAQISGFDMTGKLLSQHPASNYVRLFSLATSHAPMIRREPLFTVREPAGAERVYRWPRLILPLADQNGAADKVLVATVPLGSHDRIVA